MAIAERSRLNWHAATSYGKPALIETTIGRYKTLIGPRLRARCLAAQRTEVATGRAVLNRALTSGPGVRPTPKHATIADSIKDPIASNFLSVHQCRGWGWRATLLYDAVVVLSSAAGTTDMLMRPTARDFVADAFAHCKFIGYTEATLGAVQEGRNS